MDNTRKFDLQELEDLKKQARSSKEREHLERVQHDIRVKAQDPKLAEMRHQLVNATRSGKGRDAMRLSERIQAYERSKK